MNQYEMKQIAYQSTLKSRALQVLVYLIDRSNKEGTCFPAISTMSRELHISVSTVKRALRELTESGFVKKESRFREKNNGQTSNLYTLCIKEENKDEKTRVEDRVNSRSEEAETIKFQQQTEIQRKNGKFDMAVFLLNPIWLCGREMRCLVINPINFTLLLHMNCWPGEGVNLRPP